jgi:hypothetical protein
MLTTSFAKKVSRVVVPGPPNKLRQIDASSPIPPNGYDGANGRFLAPFVAELPFRFRPAFAETCPLALRIAFQTSGAVSPKRSFVGATANRWVELRAIIQCLVTSTGPTLVEANGRCQSLECYCFRPTIPFDLIKLVV